MQSWAAFYYMIQKKEPLHREESPPKTVINSKFIIYFY